MQNGLHFVEVDFFQGSTRRGSVFVERDPDRMGFNNTVDDIMSGEWENVSKVYCANIEDRRFDDVTEDIAREILSRLQEPPSHRILTFLEEHLGVATMARACREMEMA